MSKRGNKVPGWLSLLLVGGAFATLVWLERWRPLRRAVEPKLRRDVRNLVVASLAIATVQLAEKPVVAPLAALVERRRWGLLHRLSVPAWLKLPLGVILLDYTLYLWHVLTHQVPWLWRFHQVHHVDLDLDASTALRFHFGELAISVAWRAGQVLVLGVSPRGLAVWQTALLVEILFHHSNVQLPIAVERWLCRLIVTPRMHGIHHSIVPEETGSNWSSGLTVWDWLHGTLRLDVPQDAITIGVPAYRDPDEVTLPRILAMPVREQRPSWQFPGDGMPRRQPLPLPTGPLPPDDLPRPMLAGEP
jgi:sterol desaturase/sphingolipid hydroxylase (fatty acid hydroxylase superfamily)